MSDVPRPPSTPPSPPALPASPPADAPDASANTNTNATMPVVDASPSAPPPSSPPAPSSSPPAPSSMPPVAAAPDISTLLRKDGESRAAGPGIGRGFAALALTASLVPVVVVAAALWPTAPPTPTPVGSAGVPPVVAQRNAPVVVDFDALRAAARARPAVTTNAAPVTSSGAQQQFIAIEPERVEKARLLLKRVFKARDLRRSAGADVKELRRPFSVEDLGGQAMLNEVGIAKGKRILITRDFLKAEAKLVAPAGATLPEGVELASTERDEDVIETDATLDGKPVHIMRRCLAGELLCLVDIVPVASRASAPSPKAAVPVAAPTDDALLAAIDAEEAKLRGAPIAAAVPGITVVPTTRVPPTGGLALGVAIALLLGGLLATRLARLGSLVAAAGHRVRALVAGRAGAAPSGLPAELAALHTAIDEAAVALGDVRHRADVDESRRTRLVEVASALERAKERSTSRVLPNANDDASLAAVVEAANKLLDTYEARVLRWKSHAETALAPPAHSKVEERAQALAPIPPLLVEVAQRLLRVARLPELQPAKAKDELNAVGEALAQRGRTAQTLVDQLLLDAATDRPGSAPAAALSALRQELGALTPSSSAPATVAALRDLPVDQIAQRMAKP